MMRNARKWMIGGLAALCMLACVRSEAGLFRKSSKHRTDTLIVTGNYAKSRLLAELVQRKKGYPILLISPESGGGDKLYFMPEGPEATSVPISEFQDHVDFLHPKRVIVLGDESYVAKGYVDKIRELYPTIVINSTDWRRNADVLAELLGYKKLSKIYSKYLITIEAASGGRALPAGTTAAPAAAGEPVVPPMSLAPADGER